MSLLSWIQTGPLILRYEQSEMQIFSIWESLIILPLVDIPALT